MLALLRNIPHSISPESIDRAAAVTHGYVGADLAAVCNEAGLAAVRRTIGRAESAAGTRSKSMSGSAGVHGGGGDDNDDGGGGGGCGGVGDVVSLRPKLTEADLSAGLTRVRPSAMREVYVDVPSVRWDDIGGQEDAKQQLREAVEWPLRHPEAFTRMGVRPPRGILLYGPPGCSKASHPKTKRMRCTIMHTSISVRVRTQTHSLTLTHSVFDSITHTIFVYGHHIPPPHTHTHTHKAHTNTKHTPAQTYAYTHTHSPTDAHGESLGYRVIS